MVKMLYKMCCMPTLISQTEVEGSPQLYLLACRMAPACSLPLSAPWAAFCFFSLTKTTDQNGKE